MSKGFLVLMLLLSIIPSFIGCAPTDPLTDTVVKADLVALGTITDNRSEVVTAISGTRRGKIAYTLFTLSVEKVMKGDLDTKEVIIKLEGGSFGDGSYQLPSPGGTFFQLSDHVLVGLIREDANVYTLLEIPYRKNLFGPLMFSDGVLWIQGSSLISREPLELIMGRICQVLRLNGIPNSLKEPCPEPAWPVSWLKW
jgi:hypothetical protein